MLVDIRLVNIYIYIYIYNELLDAILTQVKFTFTSLKVQLSEHIHTHTHTHTYIYVYTHTYIYIYTHTHTLINCFMPFWLKTNSLLHLKNFCSTNIIILEITSLNKGISETIPTNSPLQNVYPQDLYYYLFAGGSQNKKYRWTNEKIEKMIGVIPYPLIFIHFFSPTCRTIKFQTQSFNELSMSPFMVIILEVNPNGIVLSP